MPLLLSLTELPFTDHPRNLDLDANDGRQHLIDIFPGRIGHLPGLLRSCASLVHPGQSRYDAAHEPLVIADRDFAVDMHGLIVPRRHLAMELVLARVPVGRDIGICSTEDDESLVAIPDLLPDGIGTSYVRKQLPAPTGIRIQLEGQVVGIKPVGSVDHESPERIFGDDAVKLFNSRLFKMLGY